MRLIDADEVYQETLFYSNRFRKSVLKIINALPTVDAAEVRHGRWELIEYEYFTCSECGYDFWNGCDCTAEARERLTNGDCPNYCPQCGAKMDRKEQENE